MRPGYGIFKDKIIDSKYVKTIVETFHGTSLHLHNWFGEHRLLIFNADVFTHDFYNYLYDADDRDYVHENSLEGSAA
jgi:hypothetical protein